MRDADTAADRTNPNPKRRTLVKALLRHMLLSVAVLLLMQLASAQIPHLTPFSADMEISSTRADRGPRDMDGKIFVASGHMRMNMQSAGGDTAIITDFAT